jgi:polyribonucleotide nucleotidyltransferase
MPKDKIREVIGTGGKVIREITEQTGTKIDIEDDGTIKVAASTIEEGAAAIDWIRGIVAEPESRRDLQRQGREDRRFRRLRELPRRQGRPRPHQRAGAGARQQDHRRRQGRRQSGEGQGHRLRRPRQGEAVDARGRPGDRLL